MNKDLLVTYGINAMYMLFKALVYAVSCYLTWRLFDILESRTSIYKEITENRNMGWAVISAAIFLGMAYVIGQL